MSEQHRILPAELGEKEVSDRVIRSQAVQAACAALGESAWVRSAYSGEILASDVLRELTSQIGMYIKHGAWHDPDQE